MSDFIIRPSAGEIAGKKIHVLDIVGSVDAASMRTLEDTFTGILEDGGKYVVLNMGQMDYISSAGLRSLLKMRKLAIEAGGSIKVCGLRRDVRENVFDALGFSRLIDVFGTVDEAKQSFA